MFGRNELADWGVDVGDQAAIDRDADDRRQVRLGDAERHVNAPRRPELGDDVTTAHDDAVDRATLASRTDQLAVRLVGERRADELFEVARGLGLVFACERDCLFEALGVHAGVIGRPPLPIAARRKVGRLGDDGGDQQEADDEGCSQTRHDR